MGSPSILVEQLDNSKNSIGSPNSLIGNPENLVEQVDNSIGARFVGVKWEWFDLSKRAWLIGKNSDTTSSDIEITKNLICNNSNKAKNKSAKESSS